MLYSLFALTALAQGPGHGISKDTRACSAGVIDSTLKFMLAYFPCSEAQDDCTDHTCECGAQARVTLDTSSSFKYKNETHSPPGNMGFGIHCVYAAGKDDARLKQSGDKTQEELEAIFSEKFGQMAQYDIFMEYNTALFTSDISSFVTSLKNDDVPFLTLRWQDSTGSYVSVLVHPPNTQIIIEVVGESASLSDDFLQSARNTTARIHFDEKPKVEANTMSALWISRATTDASRDAEFFSKVFPSSTQTITTQTGVDGSTQKMLEVQMGTDYTTKVRLIQPTDSSSDEYSVAWWEKYLSDVHKKYMTSTTCGWDLMADNHNAFDWISGGYDEGEIVSAAAELGYSSFCKTAGFGQTHCYVNTPYGYQMQLDGTYSNAPTFYSYDSATLCATYDEYC